MHQINHENYYCPLSSECRHGMRIDWDVPIRMDDGIELRADVFRPVGEGRYPVLLSYGPYGKGLAFQDGYATAWERMAREEPSTVEGSSNEFQCWEVADPEKWVPQGYVVVRVDSRGAGRSPGLLNNNSPRETEDHRQCIAWAARQKWSSGKVGLLGISYYAANQWRVAATQPPALAALCIWEGYSDRYRDAARHGGILCTFSKGWAEKQVKSVQHGLGERGPRSRATGELVCGPDTLDEADLARNLRAFWDEVVKRELDDEFYATMRPDLSRITVPLLSAANWGGQGLHLRGNIEGFMRAGSPQKWLECHGGTHWTEFYTAEGVALQRRFFDHFLKGEQNGWDSQPPVILNVRHVDRFEKRMEPAWPLPATDWQKMHLSADMRLQSQADRETGMRAFPAMSGHLLFRSDPLAEETEITGPLALKLAVSSSTHDADIFVVVHLFDPDGRQVTFQGALDPRTPIAQGWLRASHRKLDPERSEPWRPWHTHDELWPLEANRPVQLDIEIWPTCIVVPAGYSLGLSIRGTDYEHDGPADKLSNIKQPMRGSGPFLHDDEEDRPGEVFAGTTTIHFGDGWDNSLLLPIVGRRRE